ncbi:MAG: hypothetical protein HY023_08795 [Chloroflexi bacterium]|nr:hypothetical protein [Chloroflexota bacterium]
MNFCGIAAACALAPGLLAEHIVGNSRADLLQFGGHPLDARGRVGHRRQGAGDSLVGWDGLFACSGSAAWSTFTVCAAAIMRWPCRTEKPNCASQYSSNVSKPRRR